MNTTVLPPYNSNYDPISSTVTGLYQPSPFSSAYTDHPGSVIPPPGTDIYCGGGKGKRRSSRRKLKRLSKGKGRSRKMRNTRRKR